MAFDEIRLPEKIERGATGGPEFLTTVSLLDSGKEQRNQLWENDRGRWDVGYGVQERADALLIRNFFLARRGRARGFRFRDWTNYTTGTTQQPAGTGTGALTTFQMQYRYVDAGSFTYTKDIVKPVAGASVYLNGSLQGSGFSINTATGIITFTSPPGNGVVVTWTGQFDLPVRFDTDKLDLVLESVEVITAPNIPIVELKL